MTTVRTSVAGNPTIRLPTTAARAPAKTPFEIHAVDVIIVGADVNLLHSNVPAAWLPQPGPYIQQVRAFFLAGEHDSEETPTSVLLTMSLDDVTPFLDATRPLAPRVAVVTDQPSPVFATHALTVIPTADFVNEVRSLAADQAVLNATSAAPQEPRGPRDGTAWAARHTAVDLGDPEIEAELNAAAAAAATGGDDE